MQLLIRARAFCVLRKRVQGTLSALTINGVAADKIVRSLQVDEARAAVRLELELTQDFRKAKSLLQESLSYVQDLEIKLAPKAQQMNDSKGNLA
jgi:hypothetical protein